MLLEYQLDWIKIVDFLLIANFWASPNNLYPPSMRIVCKKMGPKQSV